MTEPRSIRLCGRSPHTSPGFSLIELLVAMAILSIVISIALPPLRQQLINARRTDATATLLQIRNRQEQFRFTWDRYAAGAELFAAAPNGLGIAANHPDYAFAAEADDSTFVVRATATPGGRQADDNRCQSFAISESGQHWSEDSEGNLSTSECWR